MMNFAICKIEKDKEKWKRNTEDRVGLIQISNSLIRNRTAINREIFYSELNQ